MIRALALALLASLAACDGERAEAGQKPLSTPAAAEPTDAPVKAEPVYPLKQWMQANMGRAIKVEDFEALERGLTMVAGWAPTEFPDWHAIAERGARAAAAHDIDGVRRACGDCHNEYRTEYREQMRTRSLPTK